MNTFATSSGSLRHTHYFYGQRYSCCDNIKEACITPRFQPSCTSKYGDETTVLTSPWAPWYPFVVRIENHSAFALSYLCITNTMRIGTVIEAFLQLTATSEVARIANATTHRKLDAAPTIIVTIIWAVTYRTVRTNKRGRALAGPKAIADSVGLSQIILQTRKFLVKEPLYTFIRV